MLWSAKKAAPPATQIISTSSLYSRAAKAEVLLQDAAYHLLNSNLNSSGAGNGGTSATPTSAFHSYRSARASLSPGTESPEPLNVQSSLRALTSEINAWGGTNGDGGGPGGTKGSQDSGIVDGGVREGSGGVGGLETVMGGLSLGPSPPDAETQEEVLGELMTELSNHNARVPERLRACDQLRAMTRDGTFTLWEEHFKPILMILLETLGDSHWEARAAALRALRELAKTQAPKFHECAELTLLKVLEVDRDAGGKEVARAVDECGEALATHLPPAVCFRVLNPIITNQRSPGLQSSIKMLTTVLSRLTRDEVEEVLPDVMPGVLKAYGNSDSSVRKASVVCLVKLHNVVGADAIAPFLEGLESAKVKLMNLYIQRAKNEKVGY